jgi:hypothetical protein
VANLSPRLQSKTCRNEFDRLTDWSAPAINSECSTLQHYLACGRHRLYRLDSGCKSGFMSLKVAVRKRKKRSRLHYKNNSFASHSATQQCVLQPCFTVERCCNTSQNRQGSAWSLVSKSLTLVVERRQFYDYHVSLVLYAASPSSLADQKNLRVPVRHLRHLTL